MKIRIEDKSNNLSTHVEIPHLIFRDKNYPIYSCVFMKVGSHGVESFAEIIKRKEQEHKSFGFMLWGYSGNLLNAIDTRKYFESYAEYGRKTFILMSETKSPFKNSPFKSQYFSLDKIRWFELPKNMYTTGCDKAIICRNLTKTNFQFDLSKYLVACGASKGKNAIDYIKYRTDKACIELSNSTSKNAVSCVTVNWIAEILPPYAVYMKKNEPLQQNLFQEKISKQNFGVFSRLMNIKL